MTDACLLLLDTEETQKRDVGTDIRVEEKSRRLNKTLYKLELYSVKTIPIIISIGYFLNTILAYFNLRLEILSALCGMSVFPLIFIYLSSKVFKFCLRHRLFIHYIAFSEIEAWIDHLYVIPLSDTALLCFDCVVFLSLVISTIILKTKHQ